MSIHNVTSTGFNHLCGCGALATHLHAHLIKVAQAEEYTLRGQLPRYQQVLCPDGFQQLQIVCTQGHVECLLIHPEAEETSPTRSADSQEQIRHNRLLHKAAGIAV